MKRNSREKWLELLDLIKEIETQDFQSRVKERRNKSKLNSIKHANKDWIENRELIGGAVVQRYKRQFT